MLPLLLALAAADPAPTGWPLSPAERADTLRPEHERRPGADQKKHLPHLWPVTPTAGFWGGTAWLDAHAKLVEHVRGRRGPVDVLLVGDSLTQQWGSPLDGKPLIPEWHGAFPGLTAVNIGIGGDKTQNILWRLAHGGAEGLDPKAVVLLAGTNNMYFAAETGPGPAAEGVRACAADIRKRFPRAGLVVVTIPPTGASGEPFYDNIRKANAALLGFDLAADPKVRVLDLWAALVRPDGTPSGEWFGPDKLHLSPAGYRRYADLLKPTVRELLAGTGGRP